MTRDELFEKLDDMVSLSDYETQLVLDALDALGQGPKRVAELDATIQTLDTQWVERDSDRKAVISDLQKRVAELEKARDEIVHPVTHMKRRAEAQGRALDNYWAQKLAMDPEYLRGIARAALKGQSNA